MTTLAADPHKAPQRSSAIYQGTDLLLALFDAEKVKIDAAANQRVQASEAKLQEFHDVTQKTFKYLTDRCTMLDNANKRIAASLAEAMEETSLSRARHIETQQRLTQALDELAAHRQASRNSEAEWDGADSASQGATIRVDEAPIHSGAAQFQGQSEMAPVGQDSAYHLKQARLALLEQARRSQIIEKERDELKYARGSEVTLLKEQLSSLRKELEHWKTSHRPTGEGNMNSHINAENLSGISDTSHDSMTPMDQDYDTDPQDTNLPIAHRTQAAPLGSGVPLTSRGRRASEQLPTPPTSAAGSSMTLTPAAHPSLGIVQDQDDFSTKRSASEPALAGSPSMPNAKRLKTGHLLLHHDAPTAPNVRPELLPPIQTNFSAFIPTGHGAHSALSSGSPQYQHAESFVESPQYVSPASVLVKHAAQTENLALVPSSKQTPLRGCDILKQINSFLPSS